jgi:hypothetical protein
MHTPTLTTTSIALPALAALALACSGSADVVETPPGGTAADPPPGGVSPPGPEAPAGSLYCYSNRFIPGHLDCKTTPAECAEYHDAAIRVVMKDGASQAEAEDAITPCAPERPYCFNLEGVDNCFKTESECTSVASGMATCAPKGAAPPAPPSPSSYQPGGI